LAFTEQLITASADGALSVYAEDMNGDGVADILVASREDAKVRLFLNDGSVSNLDFTEQLITDSAEDVFSVYAEDMNGDGAVDILVASKKDDKVRLFLNDGDGSNPNFTEQLIIAIADGAQAVYAKDMNGDGAADVLVASVYDDKVRLFLNDGDSSSPEFTEQIITASADGAVSVYAEDLNGDGAADILVASWYDKKVRLFLNDGDASSPGFTEQLITSGAGGAWCVYAKDVNEDGAVDILVASWADHRVRLFLNDGDASSPSFTEQLITANAIGAYSVYVEDMNGDGAVDILVTSVNDDKVRLFLNDGDANSPGFSEQLVTASADGAAYVYAKDMNGDGAADVLVASMNDDKVRLFLNDPYPSAEPTPAPTPAPVIPCNTDDDCEDDQHCECSHGALRRGLLFGNAIDEDCTCKV